MFRLAGLYSMLLVSVLVVVVAPARVWAVDTDGDGVDDLVDVCCNTPLGVAVDGQGRPIGDFDGDCDNDLADYAIYITGFTGPLSGPTACPECVQDSDCTDGNACTMDTCNPMTNLCLYTPWQDGTACDDSDICTISDICSNGSCIGDQVLGCVPCTTGAECDDGDACTIDTCASSVCQYTTAPNGTLCDDGDSCTNNDACQSGACSGVPIMGCGPCTINAECDDGNACTFDACVANVCQFTQQPNGSACDDGDSCTVSDVCSGGTCTGQSVDCNDFNPCTDDVCTNGACVNTPNNIACDDSDGCTVADTCSSGTCVGIPKDCTFLDDQCNIGTCNPTGFFCEPSPLPAGTLCDDGNVNTANDQCDGMGVCIGTN